MGAGSGRGSTGNVASKKGGWLTPGLDVRGWVLLVVEVPGGHSLLAWQEPLQGCGPTPIGAIGSGLWSWASLLSW